MKKTIKLMTVSLFTVIASNAYGYQDNRLTEQEQAEGWQLLFNGKDISQWRNFKQDHLNKKWQVIDGAIVLTAGGGGDILTKKSYQNFDLTLDWNISTAGNSGIFLLADETGAQIYSHAIEIQILDNERHSDNKIASHLSGSVYDLIASPKSAHKPAEQWNHVRILFNNRQLTVWQNDVLTADVQVNSKQWQELLAKSKFANWAGFASAAQGHIGLQDHGDVVSFKNIKIKEL